MAITDTRDHDEAGKRSEHPEYFQLHCLAPSSFRVKETGLEE
jgi:hypothetical protein